MIDNNDLKKNMTLIVFISFSVSPVSFNKGITFLHTTTILVKSAIECEKTTEAIASPIQVQLTPFNVSKFWNVLVSITRNTPHKMYPTVTVIRGAQNIPHSCFFSFLSMAVVTYACCEASINVHRDFLEAVQGLNLYSFFFL